jgi:LEA14-like dessication related protein
MNRALLIAIIVIILGVMSLGCIEKPTVEVSDIALRDVSLTSTTIDVGITIDNPNPIGVTLNKIAYDVYLVNGNQLFLAHGEKAETLDIQANDRTTIDVPTSISNIGTIEAMCQCISEEKLPKNQSYRHGICGSYVIFS